MVDCLADVILRPGGSGEAPVGVQLTVVAPLNTLRGGDEPGEIDGEPVPAMLVRELAYSLGLLPRAVLSAGDEPTGAGSRAVAAAGRPVPPAPEETVSANERAAVHPAELLGVRSAAGTALARLPQIAVVEEISGQLLALTDATEIRRLATCGRRRCRTGRRHCDHPPGGAGLGPPRETSRYSPSAALEQFVRVRDRRCRFPGCRARPSRCDLDHNLPWPAGPTSAANLCCLCRHHHRLSHQAPGWTLRRLPDGGLEWTMPGGDRITTYPPRYGADDDLPPPPAPAPAQPPTTGLASEAGPRAGPGPADDPPPFWQRAR
jgi:hypothetical protein